ncbi:MAG: DUF4276 family protein [Pseudomonadota bacterium]
MSVKHVEVLVEEPSMEVALRLLLPRILGETSFAIYQNQCKNELIARLPQRLAGYANRRKNDSWFRDHCRIVVIVDRDDEDCKDLKARLEKAAKEAGLITRSTANNNTYTVVNRIAVEELEAWYFGDWKAVQTAYPKVVASVPSKSKYRNPDAITGGTCEALERVLRKFGYFKTGFRKIDAARAIGEHMVPSRNRSGSFQILCSALREIASA